MSLLRAVLVGTRAPASRLVVPTARRALSTVSKSSSSGPYARFTSNTSLAKGHKWLSTSPLRSNTRVEVPKSIPPRATFWNSTTIGKLLRLTMLACVFGTTTIVVLIGGFFIYDATTYKPESFPDKIKVCIDALNPQRGGPENLPILKYNLDDYDSPDKEQLRYRPKLVVLGSGWGSVAVLKSLSYGDYDVTVISPTNYFLFTPLLPSAATGTLEVKTLIESIRKIVNSLNGHYLEAYADKVEFSDKLVRVHQVDKLTGEKQEFYVPYDKLVVAVGSNSNTHGVEGLEYCNQLKTAEDAVAIKKKITTLLEKACLPTTTDEERRRLLSFVVCGGGPTGVEFAAEVYDLLNEDLPKSYPKILRQELSVHVIQSRSNILNTYDERISEYATERFQKETIDVLTNSRVVKILPDEVIFNQKDDNGNVELKSLPFGLCLWSTGVAQNPLAKEIVTALSHSQRNKRAIETDSHCRVIGAPLGDVYAIGDCATVRTELAERTVEYVRKYIVDKHLTNISSSEIITDNDIKNMKLNYTELYELGQEIARRHPETSEALNFMKELVPVYDKNHTGHLSFDQISALFKDVESRVTSLPATAQRAGQQGKYLGKKLSKLAKSSVTLTANEILDGDIDEAISRPFQYKHLGSLAYIGNSAVFDLPGYSFVGGLIAMYLWRGTYFAKSVSLRVRVLLFFDWLKRGLFGRDILSY
ncbi:External alternative NAD(P)H-ubiquinone oxidoreductase B1, mitochondrial [Cyberlindnera fabianii]|uniref:External alternative NAD(P)H-ubiquinone oxidoreductase B1, mitochondrial n=1 Tax=Cyberlindnera fabianii TaxID=36022 RepID=A0A1V2L7U9_CYBFA|nr:External alternative NAD(P)H-ubiquinone oxidoreductase B1, mitochondrial [Cyberlindnera fabianii]